MIASLAIVALRIGPSYIEFRDVREFVQSVPTSVKAQGLSRRELRSMILREFEFRSIEGLTRENVTVERLSLKETQIQIKYERLVPIIGNLTAALRFVETVSFPAGSSS
tara:strand:- start:60 stop:386 length:327 start_codon:yes stop_codon:yes gene_type:complete